MWRAVPGGAGSGRCGGRCQGVLGRDDVRLGQASWCSHRTCGAAQVSRAAESCSAVRGSSLRAALGCRSWLDLGGHSREQNCNGPCVRNPAETPKSCKSPVEGSPFPHEARERRDVLLGPRASPSFARLGLLQAEGAGLSDAVRRGCHVVLTASAADAVGRVVLSSVQVRDPAAQDAVGIAPMAPFIVHVASPR